MSAAIHPRGLLLALAAVALVLLGASPAQAAFGLLPGTAGFDVAASESDGSIADQAGSHPYALTASANFNLAESPGQPGVPFSDGDVRSLGLDLPPGLIENPAAVERCSLVEFTTPRDSPFQESLSGESCPLRSQIGRVTVHSSFAGGMTRTFGVFNLDPEPGAPARIGFNPFGMPITMNRRIESTGGVYRLGLEARNVPRQLNLSGISMTLWGNPWYYGHDLERGDCLNETDPESGYGTPSVLEEEGHVRPPITYVLGTCGAGDPQTYPPNAYLTLPTICEGPMAFGLRVSSWEQPGTVERTVVSHDENGPASLTGCDIKLFKTIASVQPATDRTTTSSGLDFNLDVNQTGLLGNVTLKGRLRPESRAPSQVKRAVVTLPEGMTINPSVGAGLGVCTDAQYQAETASSPPGAGCPNGSKIGEITVDTPLFEEPVQGGLFLAEPYKNPFGSLIALYLVAKVPARGVMIKVVGEVRPDPIGGQLTATFDQLPQLPYTHLNAHFREGQRSLIASPAGCGSYIAGLNLIPWLDQSLSFHNDAFIDFKAGIGGGPCPAGIPPFTPRSQSGNLNSNAGSYTPFYLHLTRTDAEQEVTSYSANLPPGLLGKIAGVPFCPEAAIAAAKLRSGVEETANPSCPAASQIGQTTAGYGLGSALAYAPGGLYLAGPYHGAPLSIVAVDAATVGPFDLGVIIVRSAIEVDSRTGRVSIDSAGSDPIPHIIKGVPLHLRDIRVYMSRPNFTVNPTSCEQFSVDSVLTGSGPRFSDPGDDVAAAAPSPFQVAFCDSLGFKPRLDLRLKGGTRRGDYPALTATVTPRPGDANIGRVSVALPPSEFLAQEHIRTICTRAQFEAGKCPPTSVYGHARALTPLMDEPLEGPVYLLASSNPLPDLVAAIEGRGVRIDVVGRIDSANGGMRATYDVLPDAPVSKFTMTLRGGKRGLLVNSDDVCTAPPARARMIGQNNRGQLLRPPLLNSRCKKHKRGKHKGKRHHTKSGVHR